MLKINEVFFSIQGESSLVGTPTVFVRTSGCPLRCSYCDTTYAYYEGEKVSLEFIQNKVSSYPTRFVCITGGEPLSQPLVLELMKNLCDKSYFVSLETSGAILCEGVDSRVKKIIDIKTPDSGAADSFLNENLSLISSKDEVKFVICSKKDFLWAENFVNTHLSTLNCTVLYSPSFGVIKNQELAEWMLESGSSARMQVQMHKYIWSPNTRGV